MTGSPDASRRRASRSRRRAAVSLAGSACVSLCLSFLLGAGAANAQCTVDPPGSDPATAGDTVTCSGTFNQFIVDPGQDDVTVNIVAGTVASPFLAGDVVRVNDDSNVTNEGTLNVLLEGSAGIRGGDGASATDAAAYTNASQGLINVAPQNSWGMVGGIHANARNEGTIGVAGNGSFGILVGQSANSPAAGDPVDSTLAYNGGTITISGDDAVGMAVVQRATVQNDATGSITIDAATTDSYGIDLQADDSVASNLGTIDAAGTGSRGMSSASDGVALFNAGRMTFTVSGSRGMVGGDDAAILNGAAGVISMQGPSSYAIELGSEGTAGNRGTITLQGSDSRGLTGLGGTNTNSARVENGTPSDPDATISINGADGFGMHFGDFTRVINYGTISIRGPNGEGIHTGRDALVELKQSGTIGVGSPSSKGISSDTNSRISNEGLIYLASDDGFAVEAGANADILNRGRVEVRGANAVGFSIGGQTNASGTSSGYNLVNRADAANALPGEILSFDPDAGPLVRFGVATSDQNRLRNDVGATIRANVLNAATPGLGVAIEGAAGRERIENFGTIEGKIELAGGNDTYLQGTSATLMDLGAGTLVGGAGTDAILLRVSDSEPIGRFDIGMADGFEDFQVESGRWQVGGSTTSAMNIQVDGAQTARGSAATLSIVRPVSTQGSYDHLSPITIGDETATLEVFLNAQTLASPGLHVANSASLDEGVLDLKVGAGVTGDVTFTVVLADSAITAEFDEIRLDQAGITFDLPGPYAGTNNLDITVHIPGYSNNQASVSRYLAVLDASGASPELQAVIDSINSLAYADYTRAVDELHPEAYDAQTSTLLSLGARFNQVILDRPRYCIAKPGESKNDPKTGLPCKQRRWEPWFTAYGQAGERTGESGQISWTDNGGGLIFGVDGRLDERFLFSGSIGTSYDIIRVDDIGKGRLATIDVGLYAGYTRGPLRLDGVLSYGWGWHTSYRNIRSIPGFGATAEGDFGSDRLSTRIQGEYGFDFGIFEIAPVASFDYTYLGQESVSETGADPVSLKIDERKDNLFTVRAGADFSIDYHKKEYWTNWLELADGVWRPNLGLRWRQVVVGADRELTAHFQGSSPASTGKFTVEGDDAEMGIEVGAGIEFTPKLANRLTFGLRYDGFFWTNVTSHDLSGQVRLSF